MKSDFWQIQIREEDIYKIAFTIPFEHYKWNMPLACTNLNISIVKEIKYHVKHLACLGIVSPHAFEIIETDAFVMVYSVAEPGF